MTPTIVIEAMRLSWMIACPECNGACGIVLSAEMDRIQSCAGCNATFIALTEWLKAVDPLAIVDNLPRASGAFAVAR